MNVLHRRFKANNIDVVLPDAVHRELQSIARRSDHLGAAAKKMLGKSSFVKVDHTSWAKVDRDGVRADLDVAIRARAARLGHSPKLSGNDGEIEAILLAQHHGAVLLCNERAGSLVARNRNLTVASFAHLLRAEMAQGRLIATDVNGFLQQLGTGIDVGLKNPTAVRVNSLPVIAGI